MSCSNLFPSLFLLASFCFFPVTSSAQFSPCEEPNPGFRAEKVALPKSFKHKSIVGCLPGGRVLVRTASGSGLKYYYVEDGKAPSYVEFNQPVTGLTSLNGEIAYCTLENQKGLFKVRLDKNGVPISSEAFHVSDALSDIRDPFLFQLATADYPACVFAAKVPGKRDFDLFVSEIRNDNWQEPVPLAAINSEHDELYPTVSPEGMLFFSSDRPGSDCSDGGGNGNFNPWFALSDIDKYWKAPIVNPLPAPFAHRAEEQTVLPLRENAGAGFFISNREDGRYELFRFENATPNCCDMEPVDTSCCELEPSYRALLIGCNRYDFMEPKLQLDWPVPNIVELEQVLTQSYGFQVDRLENPTKPEILKKLEDYQHLQKHEYLLIVFFGHGIPVPSPDSPKSCRLAASDGKKDGRDCITADEYEKALAGIPGPRHILTVLDACFSGLFKPDNSRGAGVLGKRSRKAMVSTKKYFTPDKSIFFTHFIDRLNMGHKNPDVSMTGKYIWNDVSDKMAKENYDPDYFHLLAEPEGEFYFPKKKR